MVCDNIFVSHSFDSPILRQSNDCSLSPLQWRHNELARVSNHQPHDCLLNRLFKRRSKNIKKIKEHQSSASLAFVWGIHWWPVNSTHKGPVTRKMSPFDDVIMQSRYYLSASEAFLVNMNANSNLKYQTKWHALSTKYDRAHLPWHVSKMFTLITLNQCTSLLNDHNI